MHSYIGLFLLSLAVAGSLYLGSHDSEAFKVQFPIDVGNQPPSRNREPYVAPNPLAAAYSAASPSYANESSVVRITSVRLPDNYWNFIELLLTADFRQEKAVDITDWTIRTQRGSFVIPQAQLVYEFGGRNQDIVLEAGDIVKIYSGRGPKGNFRLNKCTGYLEDAAPFAPSLPRSCPYVSYSEVANYSQSCQDYLFSLRACQHPLANPPVPPEDFACFDYLRKLNYVSCVAENRNSENFLDDEWRVWMDNQMNFLGLVHDRIQLLNREGRLIDEYIY